MENPKVDKAINNCQVDAETKESLLNHLDVHGAVSLLTSAKFGQYAGCFLEEIEKAIAAESALITPDADDLTGKREAPPAHTITVDLYSHVLPDMQDGMANAVANLLKRGANVD